MPSSEPPNCDPRDPHDREIKFQHLPPPLSDSPKPPSPSQIEIDLTIMTSQMRNDRRNPALPLTVILLACVSIVTIMTAVSFYSKIMQNQDKPLPAPNTSSNH